MAGVKSSLLAQVGSITKSAIFAISRVAELARAAPSMINKS